MPIRAYCTICSDFFDHSRDVAAIHCGHTFHYECLLQWFQTAPNKTCPQCRKQVSTRHIINKLFFDIGGEEEGSAAADPESLQNEIDRMKAVLSCKERDWRDKQKLMDTFKDTMDKQKRDLGNLLKDTAEKEMVNSALRKQMNYLERKNNAAEIDKEEVRRLRTKVTTYESLHVLLEGQQAEVESMVTDMGIGQAAVEQLSIYCISLKKEYEKLKLKERSSNEMCEKLKKEVFASNNKLQKASVEMNKTKDDMRSLQKDLAHADKEISSLKKKVEILQRTLSTPTRTNEALSRLVFESPAPVELKHPRLHQPSQCEDIDLNITYDISTPEELNKKQISRVPSKKMRLDAAVSPSKRDIEKKTATGSKARDGDPFFPNSLLFKKKTFGSMLDPQSSKPGAMRSGYDGLGGRTKFFQPSPLSEIRPLMKAKRKNVTRPPPKISTAFTLDNYFD